MRTKADCDVGDLTALNHINQQFMKKMTVKTSFPSLQNNIN